MAITLDTALAGMQPVQPIMKTGINPEAAGVFHSTWYNGGRPGAGVAPSSGINGAAISGTLSGQIPRSNPTSGLNAYLARLALTASQPMTILLCDRLWANSGLSVTSTTAQAITPAALPARDINASTNGEGVFAAIEWSAAGGAGTPTVTITYTNSGGTGSRSGTFTGVTTPNLGSFEIFQLAAGDTGVRSVESFIQSATRTSGTMHLVLFRILAQVEITGANIGNTVDLLTGGRPELLDDCVPFLVILPSNTTGPTIVGEYIETHINPA